MPVNLNEMRRLAENLRSQLLPPIRTTRVTIRKRTWAQARGIGTPTDVDFKLPSYVKVRELKQAEIASSGGRLELGDVKVSSITPGYTGGGLTPDEIAPDAPNKLTEVIYVLEGAVSGEYRRLAVHTDRLFRYELTLRRLTTTP